MAASPVRSWRTSFLTLRDETLTSPPRSSLHTLLQNLVFSQSNALIEAARDLPPHEVTSDLMLLVELAKSGLEDEVVTDVYVHTCHLIHDISCRVCLEINSSFWSITLDFIGKMVQRFLGKDGAKKVLLGNAARLKVIMEVLEIMRYMVNVYGRKCSLTETTLLVKLLLEIVASSHTELLSSLHSNGNQRHHVADTGARIPKCDNLWEVQTIAFVMIGEVLSSTGSAVSVEIWQLTLEVLRKVLDSLVSKGLLVEDNIMSRFYTSLLHCLHLILSDPKGSISEHVAGIIAALRMFFIYGLTNRCPLVCEDTTRKKLELLSNKPTGSTKSEGGRYRPPHLRKREGTSVHPSRAWDSRSFSDHETSALGFTSSDSEHSDSDGLVKNVDNFRSSKARITAIICIQDLCQADSKSLTAHCSMLLPTSDVLHPRKYEATLMTSLLFDPIIKTRITSVSTLATLLDALSSLFLQVAEYKESTKRGSFTALSSSLGQILIQLHTGVLYLVQRETHSGVLASLFKVLMLLIPATPYDLSINNLSELHCIEECISVTSIQYARMPGELLPSVISSVRTRMMEGFPSRTDQTGLMAVALGCLGAAFSTSPPSLQVKEMLQEELSTGLAGAGGKQSVLSVVFQFSERLTNPIISFEALQVLRAISHNYPDLIITCWEQVSPFIYGLLRVTTPDIPSSEGSTRLLRGDGGNPMGSLQEKCIMAAVKVLDGCLRAMSGFRGTEDLLDDRSLETPFTSNCARVKRISSAPSYSVDGPDFSKGNTSADSPGSKQWCEAIEKHLPLVLLHGSAMVRAAAVTCFAGITSSVFFSFVKEKQDFVLSSSIRMALHDEVPSVRSAACRAIGVIACFPQISHRAEILEKFIHAVEVNTHDPLVTVRITASWALANICDSLRHRANDIHSHNCSSGLKTDSGWITMLADCALRLTKDGDKIKSNAVRALGNLSRFVRFTSLSTVQEDQMGFVGPSLTNCSTYMVPSKRVGNGSRGSQISGNEPTSLGESNWLGRMVQAFVSCVTTGNVKVRWNVCHALSNLFMNESLRLQDMGWAPSVFSILLLLLRDSSNFKIRIHAAAALAVPASRSDYGSSFSDVIQGLEHVLETLGSDQMSTASSFKYRDSLEKQLTSTTLHVIGLASDTDHQPIKEFLVKKASFLEDWLKSLCSSLAETINLPVEEAIPVENQDESSLSSMQKKEMVSKAIRALIEVYNCSNHQAITRKFEKLIDSLS